MRHRRALAVLLVVSVLLAGCGGDDGDDDAASSSTTTDDDATDPGEDGADAGPADEADEPDEADDDGTGPAVPSSGCDTAPHAPVETQRVDTTSGGAERYYLLTAPEDEEPLPLVVDLHGFMEGADVHVQQSALGTYGIEQGFVTAFPNGTGEPVQWDTAGGDTADLAFIDAVVDEVSAGRCIDTSRVYATGLSMGAFMTSRLACDRADRFAAFAPVNGLQLPEDCAPGRPVPVLTFHGTADPILLFNGGIDTSSFSGGEPGPGATIPPADLDGEGYPATAAGWAELQGCTDPIDAVDGPVTDRTWTCPDGAATEFVITEGQGHGWPGSEFAKQIEAIVGPTVDGVDANERIWEFFQRYQLPAA
jgi:polyhydroxybutyrate depolymerase